MNQIKVIAPLHGIRTTAPWLRTLSDAAQSVGCRCALDKWYYGKFSLLRFIIPKQREAKIRWFRDTYDNFMMDRSFPVSEDNLPSVVAHSFGTYILGYSLLRYETLRFDKIIDLLRKLPDLFS